MVKEKIDNLFFLFYLVLIFWFVFEFYFLDKLDFICPIGYKQDIVIRKDTRGNGEFASPRNGRRLHNGIDLLTPTGTSVRAVKSGEVINAEFNKGLGNYIEIMHPDGLVSIYGHLNTIEVKRGQYVQQAAVLGTVGKTGNADHPRILPHLHFELRKNNIPQDPFSGYLK